MATIKGTSGNDTLTGTADSDVFNVVQGGEDKVSGLEGNDAFHFNAAFDAGDQVDGGAGKDSVLLRGDYSAGVVFNATTMVNVEDITLAAGDSYKLTTADATVAAGQAIFVNAAALTATDKLTFDGSAETDGTFTIEGGKGDDVITGSAGADSFRLYQGGEDTAHGGAGSDTFFMGAALDAGDTIDGGAGVNDRNVLELNGDYSAGVTLGATTLSNIQEIEFHSGRSYTITTADGNFAAGPTILINGTHLSSGRVLTFDASAETDASFKITGGAGNDVISGGQAGDVYDLSRGGHDTAHGGAGSDTFVMGGTFGANDSIDGGAGNDGIQMDGMGTASSLTFGAATMVNVENLVLLGGHNYVLTTNDANVASGQSLTVNAIRLGASDTLTFDGSAETNGSFFINTGLGNATVSGGAQADTFNITRGGNDTVHGNGGADIITAGAAFTKNDAIDGGAGNDTLKLNGDYSAGVKFSDGTITSIETLSLAAGHSYNLTTADNNVASGATMTVDATALGASDAVNFNASFETDGTIAVKGGAGSDAVTFGTHLGTFDGGAGNDTLTVSAASPFIDDSSFTHVETLALAVPFGSFSTSVSIFGDITGGGGTLHIDTTQIAAGKSANVFADNATTSVIDFTGGAGSDFLLYKTFNASDQFVGGSGSNSVDFSAGQAGFAISSANFANVNGISFAGAATGFSVVGDLTQGTSSAGTLSVSTSSAAVSIDFSATTTAAVNFTGGAGDDTVVFSGDKANWNQINGGGGNNTFELKDGAGTVLDDNHIDNVSTVSFANGFSYSGYAVDGDLTGGKGTLHVDGSALTGGNSLSIDLSRATTATLDFVGGTGNDTITFGANLSHAGTVDGGAGTNTLDLTGNGQNVTTSFAGAGFTNFSSLSLLDGNSYDITVTSGFGSSGKVGIDASALSTHSATIDVTGLTGTTVNFTGGAGDDVLIFGSNLGDAGTIDGGTGNNTVELNGGGTDVTGSFSGSTFAYFDTISLVDGNNYDLTVTAGPSDGNALTIDASQLTSFGATVDASALSTPVDFAGGQGDDAVTIDSSTLASDVIDGGGSGNDTLTINNGGSSSATIAVSDSSVRDIDALDLTGGAFTATVSGDLTGSGSGVLTIDASNAASVNLDVSGATSTGFTITGGAGDDTIAINGFFSGTIDAGGGQNTLAISKANSGGALDGANITGIDKVVYAAGVAAGNGFAGDLTGNGGTLTVDASQADGFGGSGPDGDMAIFGFEEATSKINLTGTAGDDLVGFSSNIWTSLDGNGGNYNAIQYSGTGAITFDDSTITGFNTLAFGVDANGTAADFSGIGVVGDLTGDAGTLAVDARFANSISIDLSKATSDIVFQGSAGDDTVSFGNAFSATDTVTGGGGSDTLALGRNTATLADTAITGVGAVTLSGSSAFAVSGDITGGGGTLAIDASAIADDTHGQVNINFSNATTSAIDFTGGASNDRVTFNASAHNWGTVDGGGGSNNFLLADGGSATIDGAAVTHFADIVMKDGGSYTVTLNGDITGDGSTLSVDASQLTGSNNASVDASASTGKIGFTGSAGDDSFTGSSHGDTINISAGGYDTVHGGAGDDSITASSVWIGSDSINGGGGANSLTVTGSDVEFGDTNASNIQTLVINGDLTLTGDITSGTGALSIDASAATSFHEIDISAATTAVINVTGGSGNDYVVYNDYGSTAHFTGGNGSNEIQIAGDQPSFTISSANFTALDELDIVGSTDETFTAIGDVSQGGDQAGYFDIYAGDDTGNLTFDVTAVTTASIEVEGGKGDDTTKLTTANFNATELRGGGGDDTVVIQGNGTDFVSDTLSYTNNYDIAKYVLTGDNDFTMTFGAGLSQATNVLTVDASALTEGHSVDLDFSAATTGTIDVTGGAGNDTIIVKAGAIGTIDGGLDGALDQNVLELHGGTSGTVTLTGYTGDDSITPQISNIEKLVLDDGGSYSLVIDGALAATSGSFHFDGSALTGTNTVTLDATQTGAGASYITSGAGDDSISVGGGAGEIDTHAGNDTVSIDGYIGTVNGGEGSDTLNLGSNSTSATLDASEIISVEHVVLTTDTSGLLKINGDISGTGSLSVDASALSASSAIELDLSDATTSSITVTGGAGNDIFDVGAHLANMDITGGGGDDAVDLYGDYSAGLTLSMLHGISEIDLTATDSYKLTSVDDMVGAGGTFVVNGMSLGSGDVLTFDGSAETDGNFVITGGAGNDVITVEASTYTSDTIDGGAGTDTLTLSGGTTGLAITTANLTGVEAIAFADGASYTGVTITGAVGNNNLQVDASALTGTNGVNVDLSGDTSTNIAFTGGAGDDVVTFDQNFYATSFYAGGGGFNTAVFSQGTGSSSAFYEIYGSYMSNLDKIVVDDAAYQNFRFIGDASHGGTLTVDASALSASHGVFYGVAKSTVAHLDITSGAGNDLFLTGTAIAAGDDFDAGGGTDTLEFNGALGTVTGGTATLLNFETFQFDAGYSYSLTVNDATVASGQSLTVDASALASAYSLTFNASAETDGNYVITGGAGNDVLSVGNAGGSINAGDGDDSITVGGNLTNLTVDGGTGTNVLTLDGDYSAGITLSMISNINEIDLAAGHSYNLTSVDANVAEFDTLTIKASALGAADSFTFDGSAETDGAFNITDGAGNDSITGGQGDDFIYLANGGVDSANGGAGNDNLYGGADYNVADTVDGGGGLDVFWLYGKDFTGASAITFTSTSFTNIQNLSFENYNYSITMNDGNVAAGDTLLVDAIATKSLVFNGAAETDGHFEIVAGTGQDTFTGGQLSDTFVFAAPNFSTNKTYDTITNLDFGTDKIWLGSGVNLDQDYQPTGIDAEITTGALSTTTFGANLAAAVNSSNLAAHHAVLFAPDSGTLAGHVFLVVDANGTAGFQTSVDYVIDVTGHSGTLALSSFT